MEKTKYGYILDIIKSVYYQSGVEHEVHIPYLYFEHNGNVSLDGQDDLGSFSFSGYAEDDYLYLNKSYHGKHTVYYVGKLEENRLILTYDFQGDYDQLKRKVDNRDFNALIVFNATLYNLKLDGEDYNLFFKTDEDEKLKGLGLIEGKIWKCILKRKDDDKGKLKLKYKNEERSYKVKINESLNNIYVD